jgi:hypothetical protein
MVGMEVGALGLLAVAGGDQVEGVSEKQLEAAEVAGEVAESPVAVADA